MTTAVSDVSESDFQRQLIELAALYNWRTMHVRRSVGRRAGGPGWTTSTSVAGWPDLVCWRPSTGQLFVAELKSAKGKLRPEQAEVLAELAACGVPTFVWRPADFDEAHRVLKEGQ